MNAPRSAIEPIEAGWVRVRELTPHDQEAILRLASDMRVIQNVCWGPFDLEGARAYLAQAAISADVVPRTRYEFGIEDASTGELVGACSIKRRPAEGDWEIGYSLRPEWWGRGLGSETVAALVHFGRDRLAAGRIVAEVFLENPASMRILEKMGFRGVRRTDRYVPSRGSHRRILLLQLQP